MRTTVTLDPDAELILRRDMERRGVSFKRALNDAIRAGAVDPGTNAPFTTTTHRMGTPTVNLDRALQLAAELEDEEIVRDMRAGR
ncbi:MAG: hypothetical protein ACK5LS_01785 [Propioniciclava sp.]